MTEAVQLALITGVPSTLAALGALYVSLKNSQKTDVVVQKTDEVRGRTDIILEKASEIHTATNGQLSSLNKQLAVALEKISGLEQLTASQAASKIVANGIEAKKVDIKLKP